jgi:hypothetical protein
MRKVNMPIVTLIKDGDDLILPLTDPVFADMGLEIGDTMVWKDNNDGSWTLSKKPNTKIVMVDAISTFRMRYAVEIPVDADAEWALDTVTMGEAKELSQQHLGEQISSYRVITESELLTQYRADNDYTTSWSDEVCIKNGLTKRVFKDEI